MIQRRAVLGGLSLGALTSGTLLTSGCGSSIPSTLKIGVAQPLSGPLADLGRDLLRGVQLAVNEINAQGLQIKGQKVTLEVLKGDDQADLDMGKKVAQSLVDAGVVAVIGHLNSGVSMAAAPVYASKGVPQLAISTKPEYTSMGLGTTLRLVGNDVIQSKALGRYAATKLDGKVFALVDDSTPYGKGLAEAAGAEMKAAGKTIALRRSLDDKGTDFTALVADLKAAQVDVYVTTQSDFQVIALCEQLVKAGHTNIQVIGADTVKTKKVAASAPGIRAVYATSPILEAREFQASRGFLSKFAAAYQSEPVYGAHYTFDAVHVLVAALRRTESVDPKALTAELKRIDALAPVTNNVRFREDGEQFYPVVGVYKVGRGQWDPQTRSSEW